nr:ABC transporter substrate-binding protein [Actinomycetales bacterium]
MATKSFWRAAAIGMTTLAMAVAGGCARPGDDTPTQQPAPTTAGGDAETDAPTGENETADAAPASGDPIRIGFTGVMSGPSASAGIGLLEGLEIKINEINANGGLLDGRPIELVERDHGTNPDTAISNIRELIEVEEVVALVGESTTGPLLATAAIANEAGVPWVVAGGTGTAATQQPDPNFIFRVSLVDDEQTMFVAQEALERGERIALMTDTTGLGQGGQLNLLEAFTELGVTPVANETFNVGDTDMTSQLSRVQAADADVIIFWGVGPEAAQVRRGMASLGMEQPMIANWGLGMPNYPELAGDLANGTLVVQAFSFYETEDPLALRVLEDFSETFGTDRMTFIQEFVNAYDAMGLLADAIEKAGSTDRDAIREGLLEAQFQGLM